MSIEKTPEGKLRTSQDKEFEFVLNQLLNKIIDYENIRTDATGKRDNRLTQAQEVVALLDEIEIEALSEALKTKLRKAGLIN